MPFVFSKQQKSVALFIVGGTFLLMAVVIFIMKGNRVFERKYTYYTYLSETYNLSSGMPIKFKGIVVGKIKEVVLQKDFKIRADLYFFRKYAQLLRADTVVKVSSSLLGSSFLTVNFISGTESPPAPPKTLLFSSDMKEGQDVLAKIAEVEPKGDDVTLKAQQVMDMVIEMKPVIYQTLVHIRNITEEVDSTLAGMNGKAAGSKTGKELQQSVYLLKDNLIELKHVLRNFPFVSKKGAPKRPVTIPSGGR